RARDKHGRRNLKCPIELLSYFSAYRWPGNIRELENVIERLVVLAPGGEITIEDLPEALTRKRPAFETLQMELSPEGISLESIERQLILQALIRFNWNQTHAAKYLDLSRKKLIYRMEKFDLRSELGDKPQEDPRRG
ncbi:MAG: helix-turn-helix domain-containing protein, partial [Bryobacteraceae bacterium]